MTLLKEWSLNIQVDDILSGEGADPAVLRKRRPALVSAAERALAEELHLVHPAVLVEEVRVLSVQHRRINVEGGCLTGELVASHLGGAERIALVLCTIGPELEASISRLMSFDPVHAISLDGLANAAVDALAYQVCAWLGEQARSRNLKASTPLSPGAEGWSVGTGQPEIFALLDAIPLGVTLTGSYLMLPRKTISFVVGIGEKVGQGLPCDTCGLKETCRYRHG